MSPSRTVPLRDSIATQTLAVVLGLYLLLTLVLTAFHAWIDYRSEKAELLRDLSHVEDVCRDALAVGLWTLDEEAVRASLAGILEIPALVGAAIASPEGDTVALGGVVTRGEIAGDFGLHIDLSGLDTSTLSLPPGAAYGPALFEHRFPIPYDVDGQRRTLGWATIYSSNAVIYARLRRQLLMQGLSTALTLLAFSLALLWALNRYVRRPLGILTSCARRLSPEHLDTFRVDTGTSQRNEIRILAEVLNGMVGDLHRTHLKRAETEASLRRSEERMEMALWGADLATWDWNLQTGEATYNRRWSAMQGLPPEEVEPRIDAWIARVHPDDRAEVQRLWEAHQQGRTPLFEAEHRLQHTSGQWLWVLNRGRVTERAEDGTPLRACGTHLDITERRRIVDQVHRLNDELEARVTERTAELQAVNEELEAFAYSVSHDLRAPLRSINGFSKALLEDYRGRLDPTGADYLRRLGAATRRMGQLIDDMLTLSRLTRSELRFGPVNLSEIVADLRAAIEEREPNRDATWLVAPGVQVHGDRTLLRVLLQNLVENAWKFSAKHDRTRIEFGVVDRAGTPAYYVRDDGAGFDMAYAGQLFRVFQRLHSVDEFEGTGIGLATAQRIVRRHGGTIWAEAAVEQGATFYFTLGTETLPATAS